MPDLTVELIHLLDEASSALTHLNADTLDEIGRRARRLMTSGAASLRPRNDQSILLDTKLTGFTEALRTTGETLHALGHATSVKLEERTSYGFFENLGLYSEDVGDGDRRVARTGDTAPTSGGRSWAP